MPGSDNLGMRSYKKKTPHKILFQCSKTLSNATTLLKAILLRVHTPDLSQKTSQK